MRTLPSCKSPPAGGRKIALASWIRTASGTSAACSRRCMDFFKKDVTFSSQRAAAMLGFQAAVGLKDGVKRTAD